LISFLLLVAGGAIGASMQRWYHMQRWYNWSKETTTARHLLRCRPIARPRNPMPPAAVRTR